MCLNDERRRAIHDRRTGQKFGFVSTLLVAAAKHLLRRE
jgi:hypothetical protein